MAQYSWLILDTTMMNKRCEAVSLKVCQPENNVSEKDNSTWT